MDYSILKNNGVDQLLITFTWLDKNLDYHEILSHDYDSVAETLELLCGDQKS